MDKQVKVCVFDKSTTKDVVIKGNGDAILDNICTSCKVHENVDGTHEVDADFILDDDKLWQNLDEEAILKLQVDYGNEYFRLTEPRKTGNRISTYGRQATIYETMHLWLSDVRPTQLGGSAALNWILDGAVGVKELEVYSNISASNTAYYEDMNMYQALHDCDQSFQNRWGGEIQRRGYLLRILDRVGSDRGVQIRSGKNLTNFGFSKNVDSIVTRIKPKGADGITIDGFVDSPLIDNYARVYTKEMTYDVKVKSDSDEEGFDTLEEAQAELIRLANLEFTENHIDVIQADYTINFVDLSKTEEYKDYVQAEKVYIGDTVHVYEEKLGINVDVRVIDRVYNVLTQQVEEITLSNRDISTKKSINDVMIDIIKGIEKNDNSLEKFIQSFINSGIKDSYVFYNEAELVVCDSEKIEEAIHVWRFNKNGLAHSANGYQGPYDVALTADGKINANMVLAGTIKGQYIDARNLTVGDTIAISAEGFMSIIQGLISIDEEGIKINLIDSEDNVLGYVLYDGQGVQIFTQANELISNFTREGSYLDKVKIDDLDCYQVLKIANRSGCSTEWYIAAEATGDGTGRDANNKATSLKDVLRRIRQYGLHFTNKLTINVESGFISEELVIQDFQGTVIQINVAKGVVIDTSKFVFEDCTVRIYLIGEVDDNSSCLDETITASDINDRALIKTDSLEALFKASNCNYISISGFRLKGNGDGSCAKAYNGSDIIIKDCDISGFEYGGYATDMSKICIAGCRGNVNYLAYVAYCGMFTSTSTIPKCSNTDLVDKRQSGVWVEESTYTQRDTLYQEATTTEPTTNTKESFVITDLYTKVEGGGLGTASRKGYTGQGKYKNYKSHRGYIILPSADILATLKNKENYTLKLRMTRLDTEHGYNSKTPHPIIRAVNGSTVTDYWDSQVTFARGESNDITLPDTIKDAIVNGATRLELFADSSQEQQYSFYDNVNLIVEGDNKVIVDITEYTFPYASELVENAMTYWHNCTNEGTDKWDRGTVYRKSNTPCSGTALADVGVDGSIWVDCGGTYYKAIDCSSLVLLSLQDYNWQNGPYGSLDNFNAYRANRKKKRDGSTWGLDYPGRTAADIAEYFYNKNQIIPLSKIGSSDDNWSGLKAGDILFWAKKNSDGTYVQEDRFMHISHVGIVQGISSTTGKLNVIEATHPTSKKHTVNGTDYDAGVVVRSLDNASPDTLVLVARMRVD